MIRRLFHLIIIHLEKFFYTLIKKKDNFRRIYAYLSIYSTSDILNSLGQNKNFASQNFPIGTAVTEIMHDAKLKSKYYGWQRKKCRSGKSHKITRLGILHASSNQTVGNRQKMVSSTYIYLYTEIRYGVLRRKRNTCANRWSFHIWQVKRVWGMDETGRNKKQKDRQEKVR